MNRHWNTLEYPTILERLVNYADFSGGAALGLTLEPTLDYRLARELLRLTGEARVLLEERPDFALGGVTDVRALAEQARHGVTLQPGEFLQLRDTLLGAARIHRLLTNLEMQFPGLADIAWRILLLPMLVDGIVRVLDDRGEIRDNASPELSRIRNELRSAQDRIQDRLQRMLTAPDVAPYLQEPIITRRDGRFVIPVKADSKSRVRGVVHDRSSSGVTLFMEPLAIVELNNTLRELRLAEEEEIRRLLAALTMQAAASADEIVATVEALAELDITFAKARYAEELDACEPELLAAPSEPPKIQDSENYRAGMVVRLYGARHPLLHPEKVVPVDIVLDEETHILILTGPNTGGKTVSLKTLGLLVLMAQAGMHIPADPGTTLSCFEHVYADIGDEQSIEQSLSTFSSHLFNILAFLPQADHRDLVLLDELGAGTDPAEGAALARALLEAFRYQRCTAFVATHYPELKIYAHNVPGVRNASMEFDAETLAPTFHLTIGLPGRSNAFAIAQRLGMPKAIVENAQAMLSGEALRAEDMLDDLHALRIESAQMRDEARQARKESTALSAQLRERLANIEQERRDILRQAEKEAREEIAVLQEEVHALRRKLRGVPPTLLETHPQMLEVQATLEEVEEQIPEPAFAPIEEVALPLPERVAGPPQVGDTVRVPSVGMSGTLVEVDGNEGLVQAGALRTRVALDDLDLVQKGQPPEPEPAAPKLATRGPSPGLQLDLRGLTAEEARARLDRYLNDAVMAALPWVRIVHGKGTGVLRREVQNFLQHHPLVVSYEMAADREGGSGATVAHLTRTS